MSQDFSKDTGAPFLGMLEAFQDQYPAPLGWNKPFTFCIKWT